VGVCSGAAAVPPAAHLWKFGTDELQHVAQTGTAFFQAPSILSRSYLGFLQQ